MSDLRKVYVATGPGDAHLLRGLLEAEGIRAVVRGDDFVPLQGGSLLHMEVRSSVWVLGDASYERAVEIVNDYEQKTREDPGPAVSTWRCPGCGEVVESQFSVCWNCGTEPVT